MMETPFQFVNAEENRSIRQFAAAGTSTLFNSDQINIQLFSLWICIPAVKDLFFKYLTNYHPVGMAFCQPLVTPPTP